MNDKLKIGLFGYGCVGQGLINVLKQTQGIQAEVEKICVKNKEKSRNLPSSYFTYEKNEILHNDAIHLVVELIDDAEAAFEIVRTAMQNGKAVVSANKKMIAENLTELKHLQEKYNVPLLYEASCCASIPIIRNLEEYYDNDLLCSVEGIFNGSTNYILSKIVEEKLSFEAALKEAQQKGFAETDPSLDIQGLDAKFKLCIILYHSFGLITNPIALFNFGIEKISEFDVQYALEKNYKIKLVAFCKREGNKIHAAVLPTFVKKENNLYNVDLEYNGISMQSTFAENQFFSGKGAGGNATASAVLSDIAALTYKYRYENKKFKQNKNLELSNDFSLRVYLRYKRSLGVDESLFVKILENYTANEDAYVIGEINLQKLIESNILNRADVNVIALPIQEKAVVLEDELQLGFAEA